MPKDEKPLIYKKPIKPEDICLADDCAISFLEGEETMRPFVDHIVKSILGKKAFKVERYSTQYSANLTIIGKGIRLDLIIQGSGGELLDVEMQRYKDKNLIKRLDAYWLELGGLQLADVKEYRNLKDIYVAFMCDKDYLKQGEAINWIEPVSLKSGLPTGSILHGLIVSNELIVKPQSELEWLSKDLFNKEEATMHGKETKGRLEYLRKDGFQYMITGYEEWKRNVFEEGEAIGVKKGLAQAICSMIAGGIDEETIAKALGITKEEVAEMAAQAKTASLA